MSADPSNEQRRSTSSTRPPDSRGTQLKLYVAGATPNSERARQNLEAAISATASDPGYTVETIDVLGDARRAVVDGVIVTPTLIAIGPKRPLVMIGDLSDRQKLEGFLERARGID
jgi:hypothetical protein